MLPLNWKPPITGNNKAIKEDWSKREMINVILNQGGKIKDIKEFTRTKKRFEYKVA